MREEDRPYLRFIWPNQDDEMRTWRLARLPFGLNCSPFIMIAVLKHHLVQAANREGQSFRDLLLYLKDRFYVDDCIASVSTDEAAK